MKEIVRNDKRIKIPQNKMQLDFRKNDLLLEIKKNITKMEN